MTGTRIGCWLLVGVAVGLAGCQGPQAREHISRRESRMASTVRMLEKREAECPERLGRTIALFERMHQRDIEESARNPKRVEREISHRIREWERRKPLYRKAIERELEGDVGTIERTLPLILY